MYVNAKAAATKANKARAISDFIENYDILLASFKKLSAMNGKVTSVKGNLTAEYWRLEAEFQKHFYDAIDRSGEQIIENHKGLYKYDDEYIKRSIEQLKNDIDRYIFRGDAKTQEFARAKYRYVCHECHMTDLIREGQPKQQGISETGYELSRIDQMDGHDFEHWCAEILEKMDLKKLKLHREVEIRG